MNKNLSMEYLTGIADFFMYRSRPPLWMNAEETAEWQRGWNYAKTQVI